MSSIDLRDIISLTDFQRNAKEHINRLARTGKAQVLTVNGKASLVVQDAEAYQKLLDQAQAGRNKTLSIVAGTVAAPQPSTPAAQPQNPSARPAQQVEPRLDQTSSIAAAMQELRKNFAGGARAK